MNETGRVLIVDDEKTFLLATGDLLRREGYHCDCTNDGRNAKKMIDEGNYDLLISDIRMPGNEHMELIKEISKIRKGMPIILVTGYPSLESAVPSVGLPVMAYLTKPVQFDELMRHVRNGVRQYRTYRAVCESESRLDNWRNELKKITEAFNASASGASSVPVEVFISLSFQNIVGALSDLRQLVEGMAMDSVSGEACQLVNCPRLDTLNEAILKTVDVLEQTKSSFKSRQLRELREMLEKLLHPALIRKIREGQVAYESQPIAPSWPDPADDLP